MSGFTKVSKWNWEKCSQRMLWRVTLSSKYSAEYLLQLHFDICGWLQNSKLSYISSILTLYLASAFVKMGPLLILWEHSEILLRLDLELHQTALLDSILSLMIGFKAPFCVDKAILSSQMASEPQIVNRAFHFVNAVKPKSTTGELTIWSQLYRRILRQLSHQL